MSNRLLDFNDVKSQIIEDNNRHLLLGNGFSMAYDSKRFSFTSLLQSAVEKKLIRETDSMYKVFEEFNTKDFEEVIKLLETSVRVLKHYGIVGEEDEQKILSDSGSLKNHLVEIITNNHPEKITNISDAEFENSINFIKDFKSIYTLNYDLLLYWTCMKLKVLVDNKKIKDSSLVVSDGFCSSGNNGDDYVIYANDSSVQQNIFFLHGGLHIFDKQNEIIKNTYCRTDKPLKEQTLENLDKNIYPIFVSEGTSEQKKAKIIHNAYLNHCYKSLAKISGSLVIFGTMLKNGDEHIREAIIKSKVKNIYIGISSENSINNFDDFIDKCNRLKDKKEVKFYNYKTAKVWR